MVPNSWGLALAANYAYDKERCFRCEVNVVSIDKEAINMHGCIPLDQSRRDRRYGCRGGELASNMQKRRIACC